MSCNPSQITDIYPDKNGSFGVYGGRFVPETLIKPLLELERAYLNIASDRDFQKELAHELRYFVGRPTPLYYAERWSRLLGGAQIYFKREDLNHTGAHKINNTIGQGLLAKFMGKKRIIAETGAGQHGVASATVAAKYGLDCVVYMGSEDMERQSLNVYRMGILGAEVRAVESGSKTLKDALNEAMRDWAGNIDDTFYIIGTVAGPHPYPKIVRDFQKIIGHEAKEQCLEQVGRLPDLLIACVGGGSNAIGLFYPFIKDDSVAMHGVEAGGIGLTCGQHAASLSLGRSGVLHGSRTYILEDEDGQIASTHSVSAGLDYPGVGPEHAWLKDVQRADYCIINDQEALDAFYEVTGVEGIIPALESSHALAHTKKMAQAMSKEKVIVVNLSGRGDKDVDTVSQLPKRK